MPRPSLLTQIQSPGFFLWATGIEDTFITAPHPETRRTLDEYELTGHYKRWRQDLDLMASLGVTYARYGMPWYRIQPRPRKWDWSFADATLNRLLELGIEPIVDLVHYGLPPWIEDAYLHPDFAELIAEYAARLAERFRGRIRLYTPLNEPRITAWYCGKLGWWPPHGRGWGGFVAVMLAVCRGIVRTVEALRGVDRSIVPVHVDATDLYETDDPALKAEAAHRQNLVFLALDLMSGRVTARHPLRAWLMRWGCSGAELDWFAAHAIELPLIGINVYPMFSRKVLSRSARGLRIAMTYADASIIDRLASMYWGRYRAPMLISETASVGSVARRMKWLNDSVGAVHRVRRRGIPLVGYTWWPMLGLITWAYRQGAMPPAAYLRQMGLWDLSLELLRMETPLVDAYRACVTSSACHPERAKRVKDLAGASGTVEKAKRPRGYEARSFGRFAPSG